MFSRWCASTLLSIPLCLTTSCCTVSPKQRRCTTTTPEAPPVSTHLGRRPAASVSSAGITRCANTECRDQSCRAKKNISLHRCVSGQLFLSQWICSMPHPQSCTEMVMPMCTDGVQDMFEPEEWNFQAFSYWCNAMFGVRPRADWAGTVYGGKDITSHSNIIFR